MCHRVQPRVLPNVKAEKLVLKMIREEEGLGKVGGSMNQRPETESGTCEFFQNKGCVREPHSSQQLRGTGEGSRDFMNSQDEQLLGVLAFDRVIILWA